ncbi:hypothetical protein [Thiohalocapsa sp. ML1]|uniref:hypothetical protein n=1 Tax=Thiohalocapsa sp. ML1 TaxID=1431688 RepID=UPI0012E3A374|nr:hypothetical protein [Thiohalocapsa sp. ML1]
MLPLLDKSKIEERCNGVGLNYPRTRLLDDLSELHDTVRSLSFPVIVKPVRPLSSFKTIVVRSLRALERERGRIEECVPVLIQEFIEGGDDRIHFGALYLDEGKVLARFEGRKLYSRPMGHTTIAVPAPDDEVNALTVCFFDGLDLSGPVSLEVKMGCDGRYWVIEPTVGRTDFWTGLCSANGVNFPLIEYAATLGLPLPLCQQKGARTWLNGERHSMALAWLVLHRPRAVLSGFVGVYFDFGDMTPFLASTFGGAKSMLVRARQRIREAFRNGR